MDRKLETFLTVCRTMNYRMAAEELNLTQPAVTKQIHALEDEYQAEFFHYDGRRLHKTEKGMILESYARSLFSNYEEMKLAMQGQERLHLRVGATKTIGDYVLLPSILSYLQEDGHELTLTVDNTEHLLHMLDENELDFALVEGTFDKKRYAHRLLREEPFVGVCAKGKKKPIRRMEDLFQETLILREKGSGTRRIFEKDLEEMGYEVDAFSRVVELSSFHLIRETVKAGLGITFLYASVVGEDPSFETFTVPGIRDKHEFNIVSLRHTKGQEYAEWFLSKATE